MTLSERLGQQAADFSLSIISTIHEMVTQSACNLLKCSCSAQAGEQTQRITPSPPQYCLVTCMKHADTFGHFKFDKCPKHKTWIHLSLVLKLNMCLFALLNRNQNCHHSGHPFVFSSALPAEVKTAFVRCNLSKIQLQGFSRMGRCFYYCYK